MASGSRYWTGQAQSVSSEKTGITHAAPREALPDHLVYVKWIASGKQPHSTGRPAWYFVTT